MSDKFIWNYNNQRRKSLHDITTCDFASRALYENNPTKKPRLIICDAIIMLNTTVTGLIIFFWTSVEVFLKFGMGGTISKAKL